MNFYEQFYSTITKAGTKMLFLSFLAFYCPYRCRLPGLIQKSFTQFSVLVVQCRTLKNRRLQTKTVLDLIFLYRILFGAGLEACAPYTSRKENPCIIFVSYNSFTAAQSELIIGFAVVAVWEKWGKTRNHGNERPHNHQRTEKWHWSQSNSVTKRYS